MLYCPYGALAQLGARHTGSVEVTGSNPVCSTRWTLHEHLLFQRRLCRQGVAEMSKQKEESGTCHSLQTVDKVPAIAGLFYIYNRFSDIIKILERRCFL